ncbi:hypothetical protein [Pleomorphovibrio marinus]|uniref:hypothetical protein n=1 Tax=Pleomorphovibrio marinus TaxID=2164132 RepID=UPI000E0C46B9|nr:hypothetical protein [Pleomorphovibrio marinus]
MRSGSIFFIFLCFLSGWSNIVLSQEEVCKWVSREELGQAYAPDSLSLYAPSLELITDAGDTLHAEYNLGAGLLLIDEIEQLNFDSLKICYRTIPYSLHSTHYKRSLMVDYDSMAYFKDSPKAKEMFDFREEVFSTSKLNQSGSLTRGISFGNSQNMFVNSSLNLQMDGELAENLHIRASITDQNVPFQPEGNTQQLQDFDNVLVEIYNDRFNLSAGDVVLRQRQSEFLRYYKNVQGLQFTTNYDLNEKWKASSQAAFSIAKGKFASMPLEVLEGVLGPYRIRGPGNERFVIIIANSEKVFLDGKQLKRGFNQDYVIDYNQGEITFTPNVVITQYSRLRVDFEYAERNFSRSILTANHIQESEHVTFYFNYYREQDDRNRPLFFDLSDRDKQLLASVGNQTELAAVPRVDSVPFDPNRILYKKVEERDENDELISYYEHSTDPEKANFAINFIETGPRSGDYRRRQQLANGVVYEFVPRVNNMPQGNFSIKSPLPAPTKKEMVTAGTKVKLSSHESVFAEVAFSNQDQNLFSSLDNETNTGYALKSGINSENRKFKGLDKYTLNSYLEVEYNSSHFTFVDRMRYIEFDRDWGLNTGNMQEGQIERIGSGSLELVKDRDNYFSYGVNIRNRGDLLSGIQQTAKFHQLIGKRLRFQNDWFALDSDVGPLRNKWVRYNGEVSYLSKVLVPGYKVMLDRNEVASSGSDSVMNTAMNFLEHHFFIRSNDSLDYSFFANAGWREDQFPVGGRMVPDTRAFTNQYGFQKALGNHDLKTTFTYRRLEHLRRELPEEMTVMGKLDYLGSMANNNLRNELSYALGNGRELRREFVFLPVPTGEGTHTWRDDNGDGVQQLNEFYIAINPEEKNYIKVFVPTDDYIQAYTTIFNYRLNAKFPDEWKQEKGVRGFLSRFSNNTNWSVEKKVTSADLLGRLSPVTRGIKEEDLVSARSSLRSTLFFNRSSSKYGFDLSLFESQHKQLLSGGFEDLYQEDWRINSRYNLTPHINLQVMMNRGQRQSTSDFLDNRNYHILQKGLGPELAIQPSSFFRASFLYSFTHKDNISNTELEEIAKHHEAGLNIRYAKAINTTLNTQLKYTHISYNGQPNSPTGYEMLQALTIGNNYIWNINWLQKIGEGLQLTMVYEGRNSQGLNRVVHTGRMQVSALF